MVIIKKIITMIVLVSMVINSSNLIAISAQDKKKIVERKAQRKQEKTKGKAVAKPQSVKKSLAVRKEFVQKMPMAVKVPSSVSRVVDNKKSNIVPSEKPLIRVPSSGALDTAPEPLKVDMAALPAPITSTYYGGVETVDVSIPTDMPSRLVDELVTMVPANLKNRIENIIMTYSSNAQVMLRKIYLLCWIDDELMKMFDTPYFNKVLLEVISQESGMPYAEIENSATDIKNSIDTVLVRFENAIIAGDMNNFEIQQVIDVFKQQEAYKEYLNRCLRLATEYNQSKMGTALKLAIANAGNVLAKSEEDDFDY